MSGEASGMTPTQVFISHVAAHARTAVALGYALDWWGLRAFVAHVDIEPGAEWIAEIRRALASCVSLVALVSDTFNASDWCDQEVGWALGRGVPVIPVRLGSAPYGLFGNTQAIAWPTESGAEHSVAEGIVAVLSRDTRTATQTTEILVRHLVSNDSFAHANGLAAKMVDLQVRLSADQLDRLDNAREDNPGLGLAFELPRAAASLRRITSANEPPRRPRSAD